MAARCVGSALLFAACVPAGEEAPLEGVHGSSLRATQGADWSYQPNRRYAEFGEAVSSAGDVNGDGFDDVAVGSPYGEPGLTLQNGSGGAYVFLGSADGLEAEPAWFVDGEGVDAEFGANLSGAGDVNGDGYDDLIVGAYRLGIVDEFSGEGRAYLFLGSADGLDTVPVWAVTGSSESLFMGNAVSGGGDVNGDGFDDVVVAATHGDEPLVAVYHGSSTGLDQSPDFVSVGDLGSGLGSDVALVGDVNADGYDDLLVGATGGDQDGNGNAEGSALLFLGSASGLEVEPSWFEYGEMGALSEFGGALFGNAVAPAGDVNGDGFDDVVIGSYNYSHARPGQGRAYVYLGSPTGLDTEPVWVRVGGRTLDQLGYDVSTAGDMNGDGFDDIIVGSPMHGLDRLGAVYVYFGSPDGPATVETWGALGAVRWATLGWSVASAGDVDSDGFDDVIVGSPNLSDPRVDQGRADVFMGRPDEP